MPCTVIPLADGYAIACSRGRQPRKRCKYCSKTAPYLCDFATVPGPTCDAPLCSDHRNRRPGGLDLCEDHRTAQLVQERIGFGATAQKQTNAEEGR